MIPDAYPAVTLIVPYVPPSPNQLRGSWPVIRRVRQDSAWAVAASLGRNRPAAMSRRARVDAAIHQHGVAGDPDNNTARIKPILDELVRRGVLVDDSEEWLELRPVAHHAARAGRGFVSIVVRYAE